MNVFNEFESVYSEMQIKAYCALGPSPANGLLFPSLPGEYTIDFQQVEPDVKEVHCVT